MGTNESCATGHQDGFKMSLGGVHDRQSSEKLGLEAPAIEVARFPAVGTFDVHDGTGTTLQKPLEVGLAHGGIRLVIVGQRVQAPFTITLNRGLARPIPH